MAIGVTQIGRASKSKRSVQWDLFLDSFIPVVNPAGVDLTAPMSVYVACRKSVGSTCLTNPGALFRTFIPILGRFRGW